MRRTDLLTNLVSLLLAAPLLVLLAGCGLAAGQAGAVLGQPDFTSNVPNNAALPPAARLRIPLGVAVTQDAPPVDQRLWVADSNNHRVLSWPNVLAFTKGDPADIVLGQKDMDGTSANEGLADPTFRSLKSPWGVAVDGAGNVYVSDTGNDRVVQYRAPVTTHQAADRIYGGGRFAGGLSGPQGLAAGGGPLPGGILYVADTGHNRVMVYGIQDTGVGGVIGQADYAHFEPNRGQLAPAANTLWAPAGVAVSSGGILYVADQLNSRVLRFSAPLDTPVADLVLGQKDSTHNQLNQGRQPDGSTLYYPWGIALDPGGNLFVADSSNNRVLRYLAPFSSGMAASLVVGQPDFTQGAPNTGGLSGKSLDHPRGVVINRNAGPVVADTNNHRVLRYTYFHVPGDNLPDVALGSGDGCQKPEALAFCLPFGVAVDQTSGRVFLVHLGSRVLSWPSVGDLDNGSPPDAVIGAPDFDKPSFVGASAKSLNRPQAVAADSAGRLWVADTGNNRVLRFPGPFAGARGPAADFVIGQPDFTSSKPNRGGAVSASGLDGPSGLAIYTFNDTLYVADTNNNRILQFGKNPQGNPQIAAPVYGQPDFTSNAPNFGAGVPIESGFDHPAGLAVSVAQLYLADRNNSRVLVFSLQQRKATAAVGQKGLINQGQINQGHGPDATTLGLPFGVALDLPRQLLYVTDPFNNRVTQYRLPIANGQAAVRVFGQQDFTTNDQQYWLGGFVNSGCPGVTGVAADKMGNLLVTDSCRYLLLKYDVPAL